MNQIIDNLGAPLIQTLPTKYCINPFTFVGNTGVKLDIRNKVGCFGEPLILISTEYLTLDDYIDSIDKDLKNTLRKKKINRILS